MSNVYYEASQGGLYSQDTANSIFTGAMTRLYGWIALGVVTTGAAGWISHQAGILESILNRYGLIGYLVVLGVWLACVFALSFLIERAVPEVASVLYLSITAITGVMISYIFWAYTGDTILLALALTTGVFALMSVIGYTTKRDLSDLGSICVIGLLGVITAAQVNWFIDSSVLTWVVTLVALPIFLGLAVYKTKEVKEMAQEAAIRGDEQAASRIAIVGAVGLYLVFLNIFLLVLNFSSDD